VNAGSGAARVLVGAGVPPCVVVRAGVALAGVVDVEGVPAVPVVCDTDGALAAETVLVEEPHPPVSAATDTPITSTIAERGPRLIASNIFAARAWPPRVASSLACLAATDLDGKITPREGRPKVAHLGRLISDQRGMALNLAAALGVEDLSVGCSWVQAELRPATGSR
jgi:hypothetical protein